MPVPMLNLPAQYAAIKDEINAAVFAELESQQFRSSPICTQFEANAAEYAGVKHGLGVGSGTDAILLMLKAVGVGYGDEVITTPFTFFATVGAIVNAGAKPVFVDIEADTLNINPALIEAAITDKTKAILPVHIFGQCADMDPILALGEKHSIPVFEDCAQALGAKYKGRAACSMGLAGSVSFYPTKNLGAAGEGGLILCNDDTLAEEVKKHRCHGMAGTPMHDLVGTNSHLHALQAAVLDVKLPHLNAWNDTRRDIAAQYNAAFSECPEITLPTEREEHHHVYHQYVVRVPHRDTIVATLRDQGIGCGVYYPMSLHRQECLAPLAHPDTECPETDKACAEVLALPIYPELTPEQIQEVIDGVKGALIQS